MPHEVHERAEVQGLIGRGVQVVEVLGPEEFEEDHLPGAINIPLRELETQAGRLLDRNRPVLVYCTDSA
jgi:rhodanese-related sulfurtransferase